MAHEPWLEMISLSVSGELEEEERALLEGHLNACPECRDEHASMAKLARVVAGSAHGAPALLAEARRKLRETLRTERSRRTLAERLMELIRLPGVVRAGTAAGAVALLAGGVLLGRSWPGTGGDPLPTEPVRAASQTEGGDTRIANIRFIASDPATGEIEFAFEAVKPVRMKGNINDEKVQRVLTHAIMSDQNVGVRLASINAVSSTRAVPDPEVKNALIAALESDENAGVRSEALKALRGYQADKDIAEALLYVLTHDKNPALRITAINCLDSLRAAGQGLDKDMLEVLRRTMQSDDNNYIRLRAQTVMEEHRQ